MKEEDISSFDLDESIESNKRHKLSVSTMIIRVTQLKHEKMASILQRAWRRVFKNRRSQIYAQRFLEFLTMDYVKSIRSINYYMFVHPISFL